MYYIIVSLFITILFLGISGRNPALRIIGGSDVDANELPYVARIRLYFLTKIQGQITEENEFHICTCAILTPTWTLTAAHCMLFLNTTQIIEENGNLMKYEFKIGHGPLEKNTTTKIVEWLRHPAYKSSDMPYHGYNDIGLIKTEEIHLRQYGHISAMDYTSLLGLEATATGYGLMNVLGVVDDATALGKPLQKLDVVVSKCSSIYATLRPRLCIARRCGKVSNVCPGDSGGPLLHSSGIIAVNSAGPVLACNPLLLEEFFFNMAALTPTSPYIDWISDVMNKDK